MHIHWNLKELQMKNKWSDEERRKRSDGFIQELHKQFPQILKWWEGNNGSSPYIELHYNGASCDNKGAPLWLAVRRLTSETKETINQIFELGDKYFS